MKAMIPYCSWVRNTGTSCNAVRCFERFNPNYLLGTPFNVSTLLAKVWRNVIECDFPKQTCTMCMIFPTLSQTKPRKNPRLQYAFNIQVLVVFCNSHWLSHLAAIFIDKRAEWSTVYSRIFSTIFISSRETEGYHWVPHRLAHIWHWHIRMIGSITPSYATILRRQSVDCSLSLATWSGLTTWGMYPTSYTA